MISCGGRGRHLLRAALLVDVIVVRLRAPEGRGLGEHGAGRISSSEGVAVKGCPRTSGPSLGERVPHTHLTTPMPDSRDMRCALDRLVQRFRDAYAAGEPVDVAALLDEAGEQRNELEHRLTRLIDEVGRRPLPRSADYRG